MYICVFVQMYERGEIEIEIEIPCFLAIKREIARI